MRIFSMLDGTGYFTVMTSKTKKVFTGSLSECLTYVAESGQKTVRINDNPHRYQVSDSKTREWIVTHLFW